MKNMGREVKIELTICSFPACDRNSEVLTSLLSHLVTRGRKSSILGFVRPRGRPKYVKGKLPTEQPKVVARCFVLSTKRLMGIKKDLAKLTFSPVDKEKLLRRALRANNCLPQHSKTIKISSAY
jgi:hypothetical protein